VIHLYNRAHDQVVRNALIQSALVDLRALIGFVLADAPAGPRPKPNDVRPCWYLQRDWHPTDKATRDALYDFYNEASSALAHIAIKTTDLPGSWPLHEALLVVTDQLRAFHADLIAEAPVEAEPFDSSDGYRLPQALALVDGLPRELGPADDASAGVQGARDSLRKVLASPTGS
jgi:hypothetical protein